jgi:hypothetical protein
MSPRGAHVCFFRSDTRRSRIAISPAACDRAHQIGPRHDTDDRGAADDRHALDAVTFHQVDDLFQWGVFGHGLDFGCHHLVHLPTAGVNIFAGELARTNEEFDPARPLALRAGLSPAQEVALCDNADQRAGAIDHRQAADLVLQHQSHRLQNGAVRSDRYDVPCHDI